MSSSPRKPKYVMITLLLIAYLWASEEIFYILKQIDAVSLVTII